MTTLREKKKLSLTIEIASLKGGGGKSNIAANLGVAFQNLGYSVILVDSDPVMNTTEQWHDDREAYIEDNPKSGVELVPVMKKTGRLSGTIQELTGTYNIVLIDTGGQDSSEMRSAIGHVDIALTPVEPTQESLDGVEPFMSIVENARDFNESLTVVAVLSRVQANSPKRVSDAHEYLQEYVDNNDLIVAKSGITNRVAYPDSKAYGLSAIESKDAAAKSEVESLAQELLTIAKGK